MLSSVTILDFPAHSEKKTRFAQGAQKEAITVAVRLTGLILNEDVGGTHTL